VETVSVTQGSIKKKDVIPTLNEDGRACINGCGTKSVRQKKRNGGGKVEGGSPIKEKSRRSRPGLHDMEETAGYCQPCVDVGREHQVRHGKKARKQPGTQQAIVFCALTLRLRKGTRGTEGEKYKGIPGTRKVQCPRDLER